VSLKNVKIANSDNTVSGIAQTERSLRDIIGDRNLAYNANNASTISLHKNVFLISYKTATAGSECSQL